MRSWVIGILCASCGRYGFMPPSDAAAVDVTAGDAAGDTVPGHVYRAAVIADSPLGYWRLADQGVTARDEMGRFDGAIIGTCTSAPGALTGDPDPAMVFNGTNCMIALGDNFAFANRAPFTIEAWYTSVAGGDAYRHIFTREARNTGPSNGYALVLDDNSVTPGVFVERVVSSMGTSTSRAIPAASFSHGVAVYDGSTLMLFINGVQVFTAPDTRVMPVFGMTAYIGSAPDVPRNNYFHGTLDEVAVYDHALTAARIKLHHDLGISGP